MVDLHSTLDINAYKALGLKPPAKQAIKSWGQHLADTGASICLGGRTYLRSLGLSEEALTPCDMTLCGANNSSIKVLGALLIEFSRGPAAQNLSSKQIVYICDGVVGALLSLEACVDLGLVQEEFPNTAAAVQPNPCESNTGTSSAKNKDCDCKFPTIDRAPDVSAEIPI